MQGGDIDLLQEQLLSDVDAADSASITVAHPVIKSTEQQMDQTLRLLASHFSPYED